MGKKENLKYEYWLSGMIRLSAKKKFMLKERMKTAEEIYYIEETQLKELDFLTDAEKEALGRAKETDPEKLYEETEKKGIRLILHCSERYPSRLRDIPDPPYALYVKGNLPSEEGKKAAVIGARKCTPYGEKYAVEFAKHLAEHGVEIISGLARGIDGMGQRGALMGRGRTFAVLGSGVDVCYPREHIGLYTDLLGGGGGILSEYPPGTSPLPRNFPARNRIISGLSDAVLVMEAGEKSGSLITVDMALEQGRDVYALPGPINSSLSVGCNRLIQQGAGILISPENLLDEWGIQKESGLQKKAKNKKILATPENLLYSCLDLYPKNLEQLSEETGLETRVVVRLLVSLELQGYVREISKNQYVIAADHSC